MPKSTNSTQVELHFWWALFSTVIIPILFILVGLGIFISLSQSTTPVLTFFNNGDAFLVCATIILGSAWIAHADNEVYSKLFSLHGLLLMLSLCMIFVLLVFYGSCKTLIITSPEHPILLGSGLVTSTNLSIGVSIISITIYLYFFTHALKNGMQKS